MMQEKRKRRIRRRASAFLAVLFLFSALSAALAEEWEDIPMPLIDGTFETGLVWELYDGGELVLHSPGEVPDCGNGSPWDDDRASITAVTADNGVTGIGSDAFRFCGNLSRVTIPDSVTRIGAWAFAGCTSLTGVSLPNSVTDLGDHLFERCTALREASLPASITEIVYASFAGCTALENISLPVGVAAIEPSAFAGCESLTSLAIPDSVTAIGESAFAGCGALRDVYYTGTRAQWNAIAVASFNEPLTGATVHYSSSPTLHVPGDLTGEGKVNAKDVVLLMRYVAGGYGVELSAARADLNRDGAVNAKDITILQRYVAGGYGVVLT